MMFKVTCDYVLYSTKYWTVKSLAPMMLTRFTFEELP